MLILIPTKCYSCCVNGLSFASILKISGLFKVSLFMGIFTREAGLLYAV